LGFRGQDGLFYYEMFVFEAYGGDVAVSCGNFGGLDEWLDDDWLWSDRRGGGTKAAGVLGLVCRSAACWSVAFWSGILE
jgi:hypothetical protein